MEPATYILFLLGILGAADISNFHSVAHGIRSHEDSAMELFTHSLRGPTYAVLFVLIPNYLVHGLFAWALGALLIGDLGISIWDFSLERKSRKGLGGLPSGEYILHVLIAMLFGALVTSVLYGLHDSFGSPSTLQYHPSDVPDWLRLIMLFMAVLVLVSGLQDGLAAIRLITRRKKRI